MQPVYLDHNSTTPLRPEARAAWLEVQDEHLGNPSSVHTAGRRARDLVDRSRARVAVALGVSEDEVVFTSGGTESNNLALCGVLAASGAGSGLVTTAIEHSSVLETAHALEAAGHPLAIVAVDARGALVGSELASAVAAVRPALVSLQAANNEIGSVTPLADLRAALLPASGPRPLLHVDAVQALGKLPLALADWGADLASFSAHKVGGPVGVGVLVIRSGVQIAPMFHGGGQEHELRPGTEDVAGIVAATCALELAVDERATFATRACELVAQLWRDIVDALPGMQLLGPPLDDAQRLPNTLDVRMPGSDGKVLVTRLDLAGLQVSAGSACASGSVEPSHVLRAMGMTDDDARSGLRLSVGRTTTRDECVRAVEILRETLGASRAT